MAKGITKSQVIKLLNEPVKKPQTNKDKQEFVDTMKGIKPGSYVYDNGKVSKIRDIGDVVDVTEKLIKQKKGE